MNTNSTEEQENRIWCDGCYDIVHFGHSNSLRQAKSLCKTLVVGIHSDAEISKHKRLPVYTEEERYKLVRGIKWVDEVIENAPYITTIETLKKYNCNYCAHGDDITTSNGVDTYKAIKDANCYKEIQRTAGISTTGIINRILNRTKNGVKQNDIINDEKHSKWTGSIPFLMTTCKIFQFMNNSSRIPNAQDKIVYAPGSFDIFHTGHLDFLESCKTEGDFLIVGIYSDETIEKFHNGKRPIMTSKERLFNVLSYKCVDEVIFEPPYIISEELLNQCKIDIVLNGNRTILQYNDKVDPFKVCKKLGKFKIIDSNNNISTDQIIERITKQRNLYELSNIRKEQQEIEIYQK